MTELLFSPPVLGFVVVTRAALAFGLACSRPTGFPSRAAARSRSR